MHLTFEQKREILKSYNELTEGIVKPDKFNYYFSGSKQKRKVVVRELRHTGNGYACGKYLEDFEGDIDSRGWISIRDICESELRKLIVKVIDSFK